MSRAAPESSSPKRICPDCERADKNPLSGFYQSHCQDCQARQLAHSPAYFDSARDGRMSPTYLAALKYVFREQWQAGHLSVKHYAQRIAEANA